MRRKFFQDHKMQLPNNGVTVNNNHFSMRWKVDVWSMEKSTGTQKTRNANTNNSTFVRFFIPQSDTMYVDPSTGLFMKPQVIL